MPFQPWLTQSSRASRIQPQKSLRPRSSTRVSGPATQAAEVAELAVDLGVELLVLVAADVVLGPAVGLVGVHEEHVLVAEREEVGAGAVFDLLGPLAVGLVEGAEVLPVAQVGGLEEAGGVALVAGAVVLVADEGVVGVALLPAAGIEDDALGEFAGGPWSAGPRGRVKGDDGVLGQGDPVVEVGVVGLVDADAVAGHVGDDGGDGHALHDVAAVEVVALLPSKRFAEGGLVVAPVEEVAAADVLPTGEVDRAGGVGDLLQVAEVVAAVPVDGAVDVVPAALGRDEVVAGAVFVGDEFFAEFVGLHEVVVEVPHLERLHEALVRRSGVGWVSWR